MIRLRAALLRPKTIEVRVPIFQETEELSARPIFIVAPHRSGTSLLRRLINSHPNIFCPPETYFLDKFMELANDPHYRVGLRGIYGIDDDQLDRFIGNWAAHPYRVGMSLEHKKRWADKTPQYVFQLEGIEKLFGPRCIYVCIFRNPMDVAASIFFRGWRFGVYDKDLLRNAALYTLDAHRRMRLLMAHFPDRAYSLDYDSLVVEPERTLRDLFSFLEENWSDEVLSFHKKLHGYGVEDPIVTGSTGFHPSFERWRELTANQQNTLRQLIYGGSDARLLASERASHGESTSQRQPGSW